MKEVLIKTYKFEELSESVQDSLIQEYRENHDQDYIWDEAHQTVKAFHEVFGTQEGNRSWLDWTTGNGSNGYELQGQRLRTFIINNFFNEIYTGKYYSLWSKTDIPYNKHHKKPFPALKKRHSKVIIVKDCPLTGVCYDNSILQPVYDLIESYNPDKHDTMTMEELFDDCFYQIEFDINSEVEECNSDHYIRERLIEDDLNYTANGQEI